MMKQGNLFTTDSSFRIAEITQEDVVRRSDKFMLFENLISEHEGMYPDIRNWFSNKVVSGIKENSRTALIGFCNDQPVASAVVKKGEQSKFCHLHIQKEFREKELGDLFFSLMTMYVKGTNEIHFSLPEDLWHEKGNFFKSFGFDAISKYKTQYRSFNEELQCVASYDVVKKHVMQKLPKLLRALQFPLANPTVSGILMTVQPQYADKILRGEKRIEIRRKFNTHWVGHKMTLYSSSPVKAILGSALIKNVEGNAPSLIWDKYAHLVGATKEEYDQYVDGSPKVYAIELSDVEPYYAPIPLAEIKSAINKRLTPPQSYQKIISNQNWAEAVSVAEMMQGKLNISTTIV